MEKRVIHRAPKTEFTVLPKLGTLHDKGHYCIIETIRKMASSIWSNMT